MCTEFSDFEVLCGIFVRAAPPRGVQNLGADHDQPSHLHEARGARGDFFREVGRMADPSVRNLLRK